MFFPSVISLSSNDLNLLIYIPFMDLIFIDLFVSYPNLSLVLKFSIF